MICITVNGKARELRSPTGLVAFLESNMVERRMVAVGISGEVVHRDRWQEVVLHEGDVVDIVQMVGGG